MDVLEGGSQEGMISALRGVQDIPIEEPNPEEDSIEQPTIPDWLKGRLKVKTIIEVLEDEDDMVDFLARLETVAVRKPTKMFSTIQRDETSHRMVQIAVPTMFKSKEDIAPQEYAITTVDLGPTTKSQKIEDLDNSIMSIKVRLEKEVAKKREYKQEVEHLKKYIQHLTKPPDQASSTAPLLLNSSLEASKITEEDMTTTKETKEWIASKSEEANTFVRRLVSTYKQTSSFLSQIVSLTEAWDTLLEI